ncbi:hypothetical protein BVG19_g1839 [[Candida] boidinii]|nr:hypothetical protein BVG19_g1839 [[Candida] boidinii]OWB53785.1 hypothetical protein B5S27_g5394 [[Candida] boidinii]
MSSVFVSRRITFEADFGTYSIIGFGLLLTSLSTPIYWTVFIVFYFPVRLSEGNDDNDESLYDLNLRDPFVIISILAINEFVMDSSVHF